MTNYRAKNVLNIAAIFMLVWMGTFSKQASAFKVGTHTWVAEQVWNDVSFDGSINIPPFGEIRISNEIADSLIRHKDVYLAGSIGPDGFPDMIGGQMTTHPGTKGGWNTDDWARWLLENLENASVGNEEEMARAFTYGYFSHLSADVFAHSYVNTYAGDTYALFDNELTVEKRHMMIEGYIDQHAPPHDRIAVGEHLPLDWMTRTLIMNDQVEEQYAIDGYNSNATLHLYMMHQYEDKIDDLIDIVQSQRSDLDKKLSDIAKEIEEKIPPELLSPAHAALVAGNTLCEQLIVERNIETSWGWCAVGQYAQCFKDDVDRDGSLTEFSDEFVDLVDGAASTLGSAIVDSGEAIYDTLGSNPELVKCAALGQTCIANLPLSAVPELDRNYPDAKKCLLNPNLCISVWFADRYCEASPELVKAHEEFVRLAAKGAALALMKDKYLGAAIIYLEEWKRAIQLASREWMSTSSYVVNGVMNHQDPLGKVVDWADCWVWTYAGSTVQMEMICEQTINIAGEIDKATDLVLKLQSEIEQKIIEDPLSWIGVNYEGITRQIEQEKQKIKDQAEAFVKEKLLPWQLREVIDVALNGVTEESLNAEFAIDKTKYELNRKHLVEVPRMAERMDKEMHVVQIDDSTRQFNYEEFPPVYNAVILSKLALLNADQLNELGRRAGLTRDLYQPGINDNVLINAVKSIDGNHQWLAKAPPFPRQEIAPDPDGDSHDFGYEFSETHGFRIYQDAEARSKIFNKIFKGLLAAGIEKPSVINESKVLPDSYPYRPCVSVPYPNGVEDQSCSMEYMLPVLHLLL